MKVFNCDFLVVGGGISGLRAALTASKFGQVILLTKGKTEETATEKAQGGIAAAIDKEKDSTTFHLEDTLSAGAGLCDSDAVKVLVNDGVERVKELIEMGADFDRTPSGFELNIEGAHRRRRILHAGDYTGSEIAKTLAAKAIKEKNIRVMNFVFGKDLLVKDGKCCGIDAFDAKTDELMRFLAPATILSTGGVCQIYLYTTNPEFATGDGIAMAYRAGAELSDMEFVQFHPTALVQFKGLGEEVAFPQFLISEAVRGEGALLLNKHGERFMDKYHIQAELAPRDIVSRAIYDEMKKTDSDHVHLNLSGIDPEKVKKRFPTIYRTCKEAGMDLTADDIPVAPAAHYFMGGIRTDLEARTNIKGLWAAGEVMSSGVHGANRLASNSLLEGVVFGHRAALSAKEYLNALPEPERFGSDKPEPTRLESGNIKRGLLNDLSKHRHFIKKLMWDNVGIIRTGMGLEKAVKELTLLEKALDHDPMTVQERELKNMALVGRLISQAALDRKESRGAHFRTDHSERDDKNWKKHLIYRSRV
ncbi:MAG: L-aspartate oxidase [Candidatus Saganbacteria bacterium]|nr:L-aspartate oxidase [Candidatus Saganbacteria bacterium]